MGGFDLGSVIIYRGIRSSFVYGNYKECYQWKPFPGSFSLLEVRSFKEFYHWWMINVPHPYGVFKIRKAGSLKPLTGKGKKGFIEVGSSGIRFNDRRCTIYKYLNSLEKRRMFV